MELSCGADAKPLPNFNQARPAGAGFRGEDHHTADDLATRVDMDLRQTIRLVSAMHNKMKNQITTVADEISDAELLDVLRRAGEHRGGKSAKYTRLERHRATISKMIEHDVPLTFILAFLKEKHGEELVLNTLRKYILAYIGREPYDKYLERNGWKKTPRKQKATASKVSTPAPEKEKIFSSQNLRPKTVNGLDDVKNALSITNVEPADFE